MMILPNVLLSVYALLLQVYTSAILDAIEAIVLIIAIVKFHLQAKNERKYKSDDDLEKVWLWRQ